MNTERPTHAAVVAGVANAQAADVENHKSSDAQLTHLQTAQHTPFPSPHSHLTAKRPTNTNLYIPAEIWQEILLYALPVACPWKNSSRGYAANIHKVVTMHQPTAPQSLLHQHGLDAFWAVWLPVRVTHLKEELDKHADVMRIPPRRRRRYRSNYAPLDGLMEKLRGTYRAVLAAWPDLVVGRDYEVSKWVIWIAEWLLETLAEVVPIFEFREQALRIDNCGRALVENYARAAMEIGICERVVGCIRVYQPNGWVRGLGIFEAPREEVRRKEPPSQGPVRW